MACHAQVSSNYSCTVTTAERPAVLDSGPVSRCDTRQALRLRETCRTDLPKLTLNIVTENSYEVGQQTASQYLKIAKRQYEDGQRPNPGL